MIIKKVKAITVMEVAIAMVISGVVIAMAFSGVDMFARMFKAFKTTNEKNAETIVFNRIFRKEVEECEMLIKSESGIVIQDDDGIIAYDFHDNYILRDRQNVVDTFYLNTVNRKFSFRNVEQNIIGGLVDKVNLIKIEEDDETLIELIKDYGADVYINNNSNAH